MRSRNLMMVVGLSGTLTGTAMAEEVVYGQRPGGISSGYFTDGSNAVALGDDFVLGADTAITSATFWGWEFEWDYQGLPDEFTVALWSGDGAGGVDSGGLVYEEDFAYGDLNPTPVFGGIRLEFTADFASAVELLGGTTYWFAVGFKGGDKDFSWMTQGLDGPDPLGTAPIALDWGHNGDWITQNTADGGGLAFSLTGEPNANVIPLPGIAAMAGLGLAGSAMRRRRGSI
jgi:hypothetical protein